MMLRNAIVAATRPALSQSVVRIVLLPFRFMFFNIIPAFCNYLVRWIPKGYPTCM